MGLGDDGLGGDVLEYLGHTEPGPKRKFLTSGQDTSSPPAPRNSWQVRRTVPAPVWVRRHPRQRPTRGRWCLCLILQVKGRRHREGQGLAQGRSDGKKKPGLDPGFPEGDMQVATTLLSCSLPNLLLVQIFVCAKGEEESKHVTIKRRNKI